MPVSRSMASIRSPPLAASRTALVATASTRVNPRFRARVVKVRTTSIPLAMASGDNCLGEETFQTGQLSPDAIAKGIEVVRTFTTLARNRGFTRVEAVATSAVREAANGGDLIEAIERETGIRVRVVTGQEEARLIYLGVRHSMGFGDRNVLIVDVGGGSVELIVGNRAKLFHAASLKLGRSRAHALYLKKETSSDALKRREKAVAAQPQPGPPTIRQIGCR